MSNDQGPKKIGGEYGAVRANIDVQRLNAYLAEHVKTRSIMKSPIDIKQFKVLIPFTALFREY